MLLELILALFIGIFLGVISGLTPGIHINLVAASLVASTAILAFFQPLPLVIFIISLSITHTLIDFIPSIFLGAPDEDTALSVLPGHALLNEGQGYPALVYTLYGSLASIPIILLFTYLFIKFLPNVYEFFQPVIFFILLLSSIFLIFTEKNGKIKAMIVFILSGFFGIASLNNNLSDPLLPMLTGLFGGSSLLISMKNKIYIPPQQMPKLKEIKLEKRQIARSFISSFISAPICSFFPSIGSGQAAVIGSSLVEEMDRKEFLFLLGSINTIIMSLSFVTLYAIEKSRTGSAAAISELLDPATLSIPIILIAIILSIAISFFLALLIGKIFAKNISKIHYDLLSKIILIFLTLVIFYFSGLIGILIFATGIATGLVAIYFNVKRIFLMGCLLLPTLIIYLPL